MPIHFTTDELQARRAQVRKRLSEKGLHGLLIFKPESMYYLTGYDSTGFIVFQCLYLGTDGSLTLLTRTPDLAQAEYSSDIANVRIWRDGAAVDPTLDLRQILVEHGCGGQTLGVEYHTFGLTARNGKRVDAALADFCELNDASDLVSELRLVKSPAELIYVRRAAALADRALDEAITLARPGCPEGELYAAMHGAVFRNGGFYPGSRFAIGSGSKALLVRTTCDTGRIGDNDQVQLEFAGTYRHYHAGLMRTILTTKASPEHRMMHEACVDALLETVAAARSGGTVGDMFDAHRRSFDAAGFEAQRFGSCGYSLGATYAPSWMDHPMIEPGSTVPLRTDMVFFLLMILVDRARGLTMSVGETVRITPDGGERLSEASLDLIVNG